MAVLEPEHRLVYSPGSNKMDWSYVKTMKRDHIGIMPKPDGLKAAKNLTVAFKH
jgi:putative transposase